MGAPQNRLSEMAIGLKNEGWDVEIITSMPNYPKGKIFPEYRQKFFINERIDDIAIRRYWLYPSNSKKTLPRIFSMLSFSFVVLFSFVYLFRKRFDFIIIESPPLTLGFSGYILSRLTNSKMVLNVSDLWPLSAKELGAMSDGLLYRQLEKLEIFLYKKSFFCMGQSQEIVDYIKNHGSLRTYLFRNGVTPERFLKNKPNDFSEKKIKIVYTGLLGVAQGILDICKNIDFCQLNAEFHIYGDGFEKQSIQLYLLQNPNKGIFYHGSVKSNEIPSVLSNHHITLIALVRNIYGAVPSKIYESMAAGLPILFSGEGEGQKIVNNLNLGWTSNSKDYLTLSNNISKIQIGSKDYLIKCDNCINSAKKQFNRPLQIKELHNYLNSFLID